ARMIDACVNAALSKTLRQAGYRKSGRTYHQVAESCIRVTNIQASSHNFGALGRFTMNLGVYYPDVVLLSPVAVPNGLPKEYQCTLRERIGRLMPRSADFWWQIDETCDLQAIGAQLNKAWLEYGQPWLSQCSTLEGALSSSTARGNCALKISLS